MGFDKEPVLTVGFWTVGIGTLLTLGAAFGLDVTDSQRDSLLQTIPFLFTLIGFASFYLRGKVASPKYVRNTQKAYAEAGAAIVDAQARALRPGADLPYPKSISALVPDNLSWPRS